jgi:hypothetical protein
MISREQKTRVGSTYWLSPHSCFIFMPVQTVGFIYSFPTLFYDVDQVGNLTGYGRVGRAAEGVSF